MLCTGQKKNAQYLQRQKNTETTVTSSLTIFCMTILMRKNASTILICARGTVFPLKGRTDSDAFLGKITRNLALNRYKRNHAAKRGGGQVEIALSELENCIPNVKGVEQVAEEAWLVSVINRFLFAQAKTKRNIFILRYWFLYSIRDIADMYGERESKIKSLLFRMRNELKKFLKKEDIYL